MVTPYKAHLKGENIQDELENYSFDSTVGNKFLRIWDDLNSSFSNGYLPKIKSSDK